jgi:glyoxylase-like metal-dependent hydrolase (beta-lactamase superfamily II)
VDRRLFTLPPSTLVLPGHGKPTTIGDERPHLQEWIDRGW